LAILVALNGQFNILREKAGFTGEWVDWQHEYFKFQIHLLDQSSGMKEMPPALR